MRQTFSLARYFIIMLLCYAVWIPLYYLTGWIGSLRGAVFDPALAVDAAFPYIPETVFVYLLAYVVVLGLFFVRRSPAFLNRAYLAFIAMNLTAFTLFVIFPAEGPERTLAADSGGGMISFLHAMDSRWNAFPSLHVANPWLIAFLSVRERRYAPVSIILLLIGIGISVSTLLVRQHYVLDVVGGFALAVLTFAVFVRVRISERAW
jgi:membrane-associated phospholipid phosphatase